MNVYGLIIVLVVVAGAWMLFTPPTPGAFNLVAPQEVTADQYRQGDDAEDCAPGGT